MKRLKKWKTVIALVIIYVAVIYNWYWVWGLLFIYWASLGIISGMTYFIEPVDKKDNAILFWVIICSWFLIGVYFLSVLFVDYSQYAS